MLIHVIFAEPPYNLRVIFVDWSNLGVYWAQTFLTQSLTQSFASLFFFCALGKGTDTAGMMNTQISSTFVFFLKLFSAPGDATAVIFGTVDTSVRTPNLSYN